MIDILLYICIFQHAANSEMPLSKFQTLRNASYKESKKLHLISNLCYNERKKFKLIKYEPFILFLAGQLLVRIQLHANFFGD